MTCAGLASVGRHCNEVCFSQLRRVHGAIIAAQSLERATRALQALLYGLSMIQQLPNGSRDGIRHILADAIGVESDLLGNGLALGFLLIAGFDDNPSSEVRRVGKEYVSTVRSRRSTLT